MKLYNFSLISKCLFAFTLAFSLVNCKSDKIKVEEDYDFTKTFPVVAVTPVVITPPAATTYTPGTITVPAAFTALTTSTTPPAELVATSAKINPTLISAASNALTPAALADLKAGKPVPAAVQKALSDILQTGALNAFLPTKTLPAVDGKPVGGRIGVISGNLNNISGNTEMFSIANACNDALLKVFNDSKQKLDDVKAAKLKQITDAYNSNILPANVATQKADALKRRDDQLAYLATFYKNYIDGKDPKDLLTIIYLSLYAGYNQANEDVYTNEIKGLDARASAITGKAKTSQDADNKTVNAEYDANLKALTTIFDKENINCHSQG